MSLVVDVERGVSATPNVHSFFGANLLDFSRLVVCISSLEHAPNFATFSVSPRPNFHIGGQGDAVVESRDDLGKSAFAFAENIASKLRGQLNHFSNLSLDCITVNSAEKGVLKLCVVENRVAPT